MPLKKGEGMNLFDILGPVMVGPSSSHTAGAVRIGWMTQKLLGEQPVEAKILMYGSFCRNGKGPWNRPRSRRGSSRHAAG